jgi:hypothetical protein
VELDKTQFTFAVDEEQFLETLKQLQGPSDKGGIWVSLQGSFVNVTAKAPTVRVEQRTIIFLPQPTTPEHLTHGGMVFSLPEKPWVHYERRYFENGNIQLKAECLMRMLGGETDDTLQLLIATGEEFLVLEESEVRVH